MPNLKSQKRIFKTLTLITAGFLFLFSTASPASAKNFTIYNAANVNQPYFSVNGTSGNVGIGTTNPASIFQIPNNGWISGMNAAGTGPVNMFRINSSDQIEVGAPLNIGSFEFSADSGLVTLVDMPVSNLPVAGTPEGYALKIDGDNLMTIYSESNALGGIQNKRIGIGTTNPGVAFDIAGALRATTGTISTLGSGLVMSDATGNLYSTSTAVATGIPAPTTNGQTLRANGTSWLANSVLFNDGTNVGIGITNPYTKLQVSGVDNANAWADIYNSGAASTSNTATLSFTPGWDFRGSNISPYIRGYMEATSPWRAGLQLGSYELSSGGLTTKMSITGSGNVGIGTTNPGAKLEVADTGTSANLYLNRKYSSGVIPGVDSLGMLSAFTTSNIVSERARIEFLSTSNAYWNPPTDISFQTSLGNSAPVEAMRITSGKVGIGTATPFSKLSFGSNGTSNKIAFYEGATGNAFRGVGMAQPTAGVFGVGIWANKSPVSDTNMDMFIQDGGNVGINTTAPGVKLDVSGGLRATSITDTTVTNGIVMADGSGNFYATSTAVATGIPAPTTNGQTLRANGTSWVANSVLFNDGTNVGIGVTAPTALLHLKAGTATAGTAPLKFTSGALLTTPEAGAVEYDNSGYYGTIGTLNIGDSYGGGKIAYILQIGDPGYDPTQIKGIIAAATDQTSATWGCYATLLPGVFGTAIGTGEQNTQNIIDGCGTAGIIARVVRAYNGGGYTDWYLPSSDELYKLYLNRVAIGGFSGGDYMSSTQTSLYYARYVRFSTGSQGATQYKYSVLPVRAVRSFAISIRNKFALASDISDISTLYIPYSGANSNVDLGVNNLTVDTNSLFVDSVNHSVGINTTNPGVKLDVSGGLRATSITDTTVTNGIVMADGSGNFYATSTSVATGIPAPTTNGQTLRANGTSWVANSVLFNDGTNVGIGTTVPLTKLHVASANTTTQSVIATTDSAGNSGNGVALWSGYSGGTPSQPAVLWSAGEDLRFGGGTTDFANGAGFAQYMVIKNGGNVGIGTTAPSQKLEINGNIMVAPSASVDAHFILSRSNNANLAAYVVAPAGALSSSNVNWYMGLKYNSNNFSYYTWDGSQVVDRMLITNTGNVGINTTNPGTKLDVGGSFRATTATISTLGAGNLCTDASGNLYVCSVGASIWSTNGTSIYYNDGNVGIGTTAPNGRLDIHGVGTTTAITFQTSDSDSNPKVTFLDNGNVGIGTTAPVTPLTVIKSYSWPSLSADNGIFTVGGTQGNQLQMGGGSDGTFAPWIQTKRSDNVGFSYPLAINPLGGNVGIGTANPGYKLEVQGTIYNTNYIFSNHPADNSFVMTSAGTYYGTIQNYAADKWSLGYSTAIATAGTPVLTWTTGNVGIGTTVPGVQLDINGFVRATGATVSSLGSGLVMSDSTGNLYSTSTAVATGIPAPTTNGQTLRANGTSWVANSTLFNNGTNVGIGTSSPAAQLQVGTKSGAVTANNSTIAAFGGSSAGGISYDLTLHNNAVPTLNNESALTFTLANAFSATGQVSNILTNTTTGAADMRFLTYTGTTLSEAMRILSGGNVGIGTTNPGAKLHTYNNVSAVSNYLKVENGQANAQVALELKTAQTNADWIQYIPAASSNLAFYNAGASGQTAGDRMTITSIGNVGIGTTNPLALLDITGTNNIALGSHSYYTGNPTRYITTSDVSPYHSLTIGSLGTRGGWYGQINFETSYNIDDIPVVAMSITGKGNVGIGTTAPGVKLDINGFVRATGATVSSLGSGLVMSDSTGNLYSTSTAVATGIPAPTTNGQTLRANGTSWVANSVLFNNGTNVGIGTTGPNDLVEISRNAGNTVGGLLLTNINVTGAGSAITFKQSYAGGYNAARLTGEWDVADSGVMRLWTADTSKVLQERITIKGTGNVGIGTTAPGAPLDVRAPYATTDTTRRDVFQFGSNEALANHPFLLSGTIIGAATNAARTIVLQTTNYGTDSLGNLALQAYGGNVGIGTTAPTTEATLRIYTPAGTTGGIMVGDHIGPGAEGERGWRVQPWTDGSIYVDHKTVTNGIVQYRNRSGLVPSSGPTSMNTFMQIDSATNNVLFTPTSGNVGIGFAVPGVKLDTNGFMRATGATVSTLGAGIVMSDSSGGLYSTSTIGIIGDLNMANHNIYAVNKLQVNTIDPLYTIKGINYSTFAASISGGVKEEYVGKTTISARSRNADNEYEKVIDFATEKEGSDLWVWRQVIDFTPENVEVFLTPYGKFANVYYIIKDNQLIIHSDKPVTLSYRLIGRRFDWRQWPTKALDQTGQGMRVE